MEDHFEMDKELMQDTRIILRWTRIILRWTSSLAMSMFASPSSLKGGTTKIMDCTIGDRCPYHCSVAPEYRGPYLPFRGDFRNSYDYGALRRRRSVRASVVEVDIQPYEAHTATARRRQHTIFIGWHLSEKSAAQIFMATLKAVAFCHDHGIMHGNIKLENLLLPHHGCSYNDIKLCDFGSVNSWPQGRGLVPTLDYVL
ncbi:hypothetical protein KP509_32G027200 [Ceratopteris richardii]|uniref:Protein kinase domain-containing protein n=1 Tax=Ceratopteris richardii TaxID=49495 RepID=A0A8T2QRW1_CERRI|nr:hypothetical protein KP509_32G027200 [Ceratopteris richardii]